MEILQRLPRVSPKKGDRGTVAGEDSLIDIKTASFIKRHSHALSYHPK